jgi:hypothetical protein
LFVPYEVYCISSVFHCKKIWELHVKKICENGPYKIREILAPHLLQRGLGRVSSVKYYSSLSGLINLEKFHKGRLLA